MAGRLTQPFHVQLLSNPWSGGVEGGGGGRETTQNCG